jgi:hypothetical protein
MHCIAHGYWSRRKQLKQPPPGVDLGKRRRRPSRFRLAPTADGRGKPRGWVELICNVMTAIGAISSGFESNVGGEGAKAARLAADRARPPQTIFTCISSDPRPDPNHLNR